MGSTAYNALGCQGWKFNERTLCRTLFDVETQRKLDHGIQHKVYYEYWLMVWKIDTNYYQSDTLKTLILTIFQTKWYWLNKKKKKLLWKLTTLKWICHYISTEKLILDTDYKTIFIPDSWSSHCGFVVYASIPSSMCNV